MIFFFILILVCRVYSLEPPRTYVHVKENRKDIPILPPDLALCSNNPYFQHIFMVPKLLEPLKFDCISPRFSAIFTNGNNIFNFLFAPLSKMACNLKKIPPNFCKLFFLRTVPNDTGGKSRSESVASHGNVPIHFLRETKYYFSSPGEQLLTRLSTMDSSILII